MLSATVRLIDSLKDPIKEIEIIRKGIRPETIEGFLKPRCFVVQDVLERLHIPASTYKSKKRAKSLLDPSATEKLIRLVSVINRASEILGENEAKHWLYKKIESLGNREPINLLDTEAGHRLVEHALQQIKYGIYN